MMSPLTVVERVAMLENERQHTTAALRSLADRFDAMSAKQDQATFERREQITQLSGDIAEMRTDMRETASAERGYGRGFLGGLLAVTGIGGGVIGAKAGAFLQFLTQLGNK